MLLRICLILAILAGVGVIGVSQFMLRPQIEGIMKERQDNKEGWEKTKQRFLGYNHIPFGRKKAKVSLLYVL